MLVKSKKNITMFINAGQSESSLPLGTVLGNLGINSSNFCKGFDLFTEDLSSFFLLKVNIEINDDRSTTFTIKKPSTTCLLNWLKFEKVEKVRKVNFFIEEKNNCVLLKDFIQVCLFQFPGVDIKKSFFIVWGSAKSMNLKIVVKRF